MSSKPNFSERRAIERDRDLAWELVEVQPENPRIAQLVGSVLQRAPGFVSMHLVLGRHREAIGDIPGARAAYATLISSSSGSVSAALASLRDLERREGNLTEALRLAEQVVQREPEDWQQQMQLGVAQIWGLDPETGFDQLDRAVAHCAVVDARAYPDVLARRAAYLLDAGAEPARLLIAAEEAITASPANVQLSTVLAFAYAYHYRLHEARDMLLRVLRMDPTDGAATMGMSLVQSLVKPLDSGDATIQDLRDAGLGEYMWRMLRDYLYGTDVASALAALDAVMPSGLAASLLPPAPDPRAAAGDPEIARWHDGQIAGAGGLWHADSRLRLLSSAEIEELDSTVAAEPSAWSPFAEQDGFYGFVMTDDAGGYAGTGAGGRFVQRTADGDEQVLAENLADWLWDRVADFGGADPRPGAALKKGNR
ncbi:hypothetical protein GCM10009860_23430 [Microbacterium mitrae]|uniref:Tetratricopeptide repeat protein n=1 Tax=Microbacterium mitrae TaxID=664640 RepID=A0A5C8HL77_9MICO|nr:tetratricopeptide repeat protein [Microbacterium mitrae]TXK03985.1 tetratricopeptide repeat protein [Microbacterium mitrae]